jgi:hypothetical protein
MTHLSGTAIAIGALSLAVVMFFKIATPGIPMQASDTEVVVGACAAAIMSMRWVIRRATRRGLQP